MRGATFAFEKTSRNIVVYLKKKRKKLIIVFMRLFVTFKISNLSILHVKNFIIFSHWHVCKTVEYMVRLNAMFYCKFLHRFCMMEPCKKMLLAFIGGKQLYRLKLWKTSFDLENPSNESMNAFYNFWAKRSEISVDILFLYQLPAVTLWFIDSISTGKNPSCAVTASGSKLNTLGELYLGARRKFFFV